ncbi:MAG TPA: hypothetical protein VFP55_13655 [Solirubrobacteraceae bacterium]|nr:hypothetical protein [Solirubrobacteraceae bacterium]
MPDATTRLPAVSRPARGFTTSRAQRWVLTAGLLTLIIYTFRRIVEPTTSAAPRGGSAARLAGHGSPPPSLEHWAVSYGAAFLGLSILAMATPELAASIAALAVAGNLLSNGSAITSDITRLQGASTPVRAATPALGSPNAAQVNQATGAAR